MLRDLLLEKFEMLQSVMCLLLKCWQLKRLRLQTSRMIVTYTGRSQRGPHCGSVKPHPKSLLPNIEGMMQVKQIPFASMDLLMQILGISIAGGDSGARQRYTHANVAARHDSVGHQIGKKTHSVRVGQEGRYRRRRQVRSLRTSRFGPTLSQDKDWSLRCRPSDLRLLRWLITIRVLLLHRDNSRFDRHSRGEKAEFSSCDDITEYNYDEQKYLVQASRRVPDTKTIKEVASVQCDLYKQEDS